MDCNMSAYSFKRSCNCWSESMPGMLALSLEWLNFRLCQSRFQCCYTLPSELFSFRSISARASSIRSRFKNLFFCLLQVSRPSWICSTLLATYSTNPRWTTLNPARATPPLTVRRYVLADINMAGTEIMTNQAEDVMPESPFYNESD